MILLRNSAFRAGARHESHATGVPNALPPHDIGIGVLIWPRRKVCASGGGPVQKSAHLRHGTNVYNILRGMGQRPATPPAGGSLTESFAISATATNYLGGTSSTPDVTVSSKVP